MPLYTWHPFGDLEAILASHSGYYPGQWKGRQDETSAVAAVEWRPAAAVHETPESYQIRLHLPSVEPKDVRISGQDGLLAVSRHREQIQGHREGRTHRVECRHGYCARGFGLPDDADQGNMEAVSKMENCA